VATDVLGVSGRAMLAALLEGQDDPEALAELARGRLRTKLPALRQALAGRVQAHHRVLLAQLLAHIDFLEGAIADLQLAVEEQLAPFAEAVELLQTIPGVGATAAGAIVAEIGDDIPHPRQYPWRSHRPAPRDRDGDRSGASALRPDLALAPRRGAGAGRAGLRGPLAPRRGTPHPAGSDIAQWHR
jgi:transposase